MMRKSLFVLFLSMGLLYACQPDDTLSSSEKVKGELTEEVQQFFNGVTEENGVYLYHDEKNDSMLVYLNGHQIKQGDPAYHFSNFDVKAEGDQLYLSYETDTTTDYSSDIENQRFYEVNLDKGYDTIKLFNNGDETAFHAISGNLE
ncbi:hypothetical protein KP77_34590 [Jeotgalibacillus alimentarius]|uniref:Lipoprotein n=1 Tax=Jeotgalibacillus alimentarius TaxID=135826 RepID=A0A0C2RM24_9BACL|nr:hypothetical protein [Jeotgalibacillus alimentarius]KIL42829.1 hypothetical protein KP77_34590 [Jeotgalibacillus alimentarius]